MHTIEVEQHQAVGANGEAQVAQLARLRAVGVSSGWVLVKELFGWRRFRNRREVAGCLGLVPSPYASGESETEQGISRPATGSACFDGGTLLVGCATSRRRIEPVV
jgi:transposase